MAIFLGEPLAITGVFNVLIALPFQEHHVDLYSMEPFIIVLIHEIIIYVCASSMYVHGLKTQSFLL
jgi:hypothetical protein